MRLTTCIAYAPASNDMNIGAEYNQLIADSGTEWVCFLDHDAMWLRQDWMHHIVRAIESLPNLGLLTCQTNRIGQPAQLWQGRDLWDCHDIAHLRRQAKSLDYSTRMLTSDELTSGVVMVTSKTAHARAGGFHDGFLGVDNNYHERIQAAGMETHVLMSQPVYHWYRGDKDFTHLRRSRTRHGIVLPGSA